MGLAIFVSSTQGKKRIPFLDRILVDWASFCREVAIDQLLEHPTKIGGPGKVYDFLLFEYLFQY